MLKIHVKQGVLTLEEAFALLSGELKAELLTPEQKACVTETDAAVATVELDAEAEYALGEHCVRVTQPCVVEGHGAKISGDAPISFVVGVSDVTFREVVFARHRIVMKISPFAQSMEHVHFLNCVFTELETYAVVAGCERSGGVLRDLVFDGCSFIGLKGTDTYAGGDGVWFLNFAAALSDDTCDVNDCLLDGVEVRNCKVYGGHRMFADVWSTFAMPVLEPTKHKFHNNKVTHVKFLHNDFSDCMDPYVNVVASSFSPCSDCRIEDLEVAYNTIKVGLWSVYLSGTEPYLGAASSGTISGVSIHDNDISVYEGGVGEASMGVAIQAGRIDYYGDTHAVTGLVEKVSICNNVFRNMTRGILVNATCVLFDAPNNIVEDCVARDILIEGNKFYDVEEVFDIWASNHEGRRVDWNIGVPPHEVVWGELLEDRDTLTVQTKNNRLENIVIRNNFASGYRYQYKIYGVKAFGQGVASNNVCEVKLENNHFEHGEGHYHIADFEAHDNVHDGGGNRAIVTEQP